MARNEESTEPTAATTTTEQASEQGDKPAKKTRRTAKKTAKKAVKKAAKKTAKKTTKKTAKKATKRTAKRATKADQPDQPVQAAPQTAPNPYTDFDRSKLTEKMRVFTLAKELGVPSKELVVALADIGLVKAAQSTLSKAESEQLLDALSSTAPTTTPAEAQDDADEKIRHRVRKDVENEIHQIEEKVEAELRTDEQPEAEPLTDVEPDLTPAPEEGEPAEAAYTPVFKAPSRSKRRHASRATSTDTKSESSAEKDEAEEGKAEEQQGVEKQEPAEPKRGRRRSRRSKQAAEAPVAPEVNEAEEVEETPAVADTLLGEDIEDIHEIDEPVEDEHDVELIEEPKAIKGSSRLEAQRRRRSEKREEQRKRSRIVSQAEFLARRESVERHMVVRERDRHDGQGRITQVGVLEDGLLVEHFVTSEAQASMIGNIYLGRVQNVLPSMEAAFIDIGQGRNGVLYASEVDWKSAGLGGRSRRIEQALKSGDQVLVQVTKDPIGHKGARLSTQISLAGRYLVYVPGGRSAGISRKLPAPERKRLKQILNNVVPGKGGAIIRTAAEGVSEEAIGADVNRLHNQWTAIQERAEKEKNSKGAKPVTLYEEPNLLVKVVRDLFNEDFTSLIVDGKKAWNTIHAYVQSVAPDLLDRVEKFDRNAHGGKDAFEVHRVDEQISKALSRLVWLPSGGSLVIDRTEAMTVIDVNTGKFTGSGGSLEETVTSNNLEAAEEIVRQIRLRDIGGMIIIDFIDMILPENQDLVLRRLKEALGRDRTRHQVSEVTSLGLVQMTRKRLGTGLLETFSTTCECCDGRGVILSEDPVDAEPQSVFDRADKPKRKRGRKEKQQLHDDLDNLIDSVITDEDESEDAKVEEQGEEQGEKRRSRRRGRRGGSRGRGRSEQAEQAEQTEQPTEQVQDQESKSTQSYEEAVEEFESSPRRKRRTRGNSRSDQRPRKEDFVEQPKQDEPKREETKREETKAAPSASSSRRGRRRATRKTSTQANRSTQAVQSVGKKDAGAEKRREAKAPESSGRRGRRRATRRRND